MGWTDERVGILKKLWTEGLSASQIAKELGGVSRNSVIGKVHRLGLSGRAAPSKPNRTVYRAPRPAPAPAAPRRLVEPTALVVPFEDRPDAAGLQPIPFEDRPTHYCKWPFGDPKCAGYGECGRPVGVRPDGRRRSWCDEHQAASQPDRPFGRTDVKAMIGWVDKVEGRRPAPQRRFSDSGRHLYSGSE